ncbi:MAG TPA: hypothetical protein VN893_05910 [Bryobacteraceae bacterium]|nr:hypothetical protein [Bryobacteraceae bacterium]
MPDITGVFSGTFASRAFLSTGDQPNHELSMAEIAGVQRSSDPDWNGVRMTFWGTRDVQSGLGTERGYFLNEHAGGDRCWGTLEGTVAQTETSLTAEGTFRFTGGTGKFSGITGQGTYRGRMTSPITVETEWAGTYHVAGTKTAGAA